MKLKDSSNRAGLLQANKPAGNKVHWFSPFRGSIQVTSDRIEGRCEKWALPRLEHDAETRAETGPCTTGSRDWGRARHRLE